MENNPVKNFSFNLDNDDKNILVIGIGESGKKAVEDFPSFDKLRKENSIIDSITLCDDSIIYDNEDIFNQIILNKMEIASILFVLVNIEKDEDVKSALNIASLIDEKKKKLKLSFCVCYGERNSETIDKLRYTYDKIILTDKLEYLVTPVYFTYVKMYYDNWLSCVDYYDIDIGIDNIDIGINFKIKFNSLDESNDINSCIQNKLSTLGFITQKETCCLACFTMSEQAISNFGAAEFDVFYEILCEYFDKNRMVCNIHVDELEDDYRYVLEIVYNHL